MTKPPFRVLCVLVAIAAVLTTTVAVSAMPKRSIAESGTPLAPENLRLDPLYDTVLQWDQERNPPHYVFEWRVYLDGVLQTSLRTNRYNMPVGARNGTYSVEAVTKAGVASPKSKDFAVSTAEPTVSANTPLQPHNLRLDPLYKTVLLWDQDRNPPHYVFGWRVYLDGVLQTSLRTNRYNMPLNGRIGSFTVEAVTRQGVASPLSEPFTTGTTQPPVVEPPVTQPPVVEPPVTQPPVGEPPVVDPVIDPPIAPPVIDPPVAPPAEPPVAVPPVAPPAVPPVVDPPVNPGNLVWGYDDTPPAADRVKPPLNVVTTDPIYGTEIRRRTDATGTRFDRNTYSRRQAENANGTYYMTYHGNSTYRVYSRQTNVLVRETAVHPNGEPQWHPTNPAVLRHVKGNNSYVGDLQLYETNVVSGETTVVADLTSRVQSRIPGAQYMIDRAEGSPSMNGNRYAWMVYDGSETPIGMVSYDLATDRVIGTIDGLREGQFGRLDYVSMSPTGSYVIAGYGNATVVYNADLTNGRIINDKTDHSDIALDAGGGDAYVYIDFSSGPDAGYLVSVDLDTLARTRIFRVYGGANTSVHVSGKGYGKPGWVLVSTYNCKNAGAWTCDKVMAVEMAEGGRVLNLAHTYNCGDNYWTETHAVVNRDFTRAYFNTDSGSCGIDAEVMELTIPAFD